MKLAWDIGPKPGRDERGHRLSTHPEVYNTHRWHKLARRFIAMHPLCVECGKRGIIRAAEVADHIIPLDVILARGGDPYDESNLQPLCAACNISKGNRDKRLIDEVRRSGDRGSQSLGRPRK